MGRKEVVERKGQEEEEAGYEDGDSQQQFQHIV